MNEIIFNKEYRNISLKSKAIYFYMKTAEDISKVSVYSLSKASYATRKTIGLGMKELIDNGFISREYLSGNGGRVKYAILK